MKIKIPMNQQNIILDDTYQNLSHIRLTKLQSNSCSSLVQSIDEQYNEGKKRCSFKYLNPSSTHKNTIICEFSNKISSHLKVKPQSKICHYKLLFPQLSRKSSQEQSIKQQNDYNEYLNRISNTQYNISTINLKIEQNNPFPSIYMTQSQQSDIKSLSNEKLQKQENRACEKKKKISKTKEKRKILLNDQNVKVLIEEYKQIKDQNCLKNIKEAFLRHINSNLSEDTKNMYVNKMGGGVQFGQIKKKINFSLKENSTNNKCIKFMCKSNQVKPAFHYFLEHIEEFWLNDSKVQNKETCKIIVQFLIKIINNVQCVDFIEHYQTK
ncbi:hypothetical protein TTHERM_00133530 (macronuclear) [Tetrahymena thermophila SB210]|uniref:Uncharacterized protein n=1 Tax=Tetrahymena thermophila (strain SB210) TaxID=312017 RepID=I7M261_TETTS|nr:hypothetical protein TTHERM_00133530 [Tetrahymena thermophila SB210]EAR99387.1 hypothetical protein TTHERM_00133530 [Tetrahymena thermophila SB210]|eukprot:XP_001019632.1 hypothetical protein TTHERM_00133530 [Tetrahymena thermophila SB210]